MKNDEKQREALLINTMYGTYADVLFVLFPFLVIALQRVWNGDVGEILLQPDLSVAAAILAGLSLGKFVLGLVADPSLSQYKERIVMFIAVTLFFVLGPAVILITHLLSTDEPNQLVSFAQPVLLVIAISLYSIAVTISNILTHNHDAKRNELKKPVSIFETAESSPEDI